MTWITTLRDSVSYETEAMIIENRSPRPPSVHELIRSWNRRLDDFTAQIEQPVTVPSPIKVGVNGLEYTMGQSTGSTVTICVYPGVTDSTALG